MTVVEYGCLVSRGESEDDITLQVRLRDQIEGGRVRVVFRHFPLVDAHPGALFAALAAEAAARQGAFWRLWDGIEDALAPMRVDQAHGLTKIVRGTVAALKWLNEPQRPQETPPDIRLELQPASILQIARRSGLDLAQLESDLRHPAVARKILRDVDTGIRSGVNGAPTFYVQGVRQDVEGAAELVERVERALIGDLAALWPPSHDHASASHRREAEAEFGSILGRRREHGARTHARPAHQTQ